MRVLPITIVSVAVLCFLVGCEALPDPVYELEEVRSSRQVLVLANRTSDPLRIHAQEKGVPHVTVPDGEAFEFSFEVVTLVELEMDEASGRYKKVSQTMRAVIVNVIPSGYFVQSGVNATLRIGHVEQPYSLHRFTFSTCPEDGWRIASLPSQVFEISAFEEGRAVVPEPICPSSKQ